MEDDAWVIKVRRPVRREGSAQYMVLIVVSFALSIIITRAFLSLSGYPQVGSGELHIAHVLWGGLLLFIAALIPLLFANRQAYRVSAILVGVGIGLFIDEVGKFITQRNDYFYPAAAPIIYLFFMFTILLLLQMRRREKLTARAELFRALEALQDWIYHPLNKKEQSVVEGRLVNVSTSNSPEFLVSLASQLLTILQQDPRPAVVERSDLWARYSNQFDRWISERGLRILMAVGFLVMAAIAFKNPINFLLGHYLPPFLQALVIDIHSGRWYGGETSPGLYQARLGMEIILGCLLVISALLLFFKRPRYGIPLAFGTLMLYIVAVNVLLFYFEQFSTIIFVFYQFLLLLGLIYYRTHFTAGPKVKW